ncbi:hypothetical protein B0H13DRAFT_377925 [Mycena leptocephala]|nr:hypothetical protein B0H13DRAFT_377925 [Mycena leptocephala]
MSLLFWLQPPLTLCSIPLPRSTSPPIHFTECVGIYHPMRPPLRSRFFDKMAQSEYKSLIQYSFLGWHRFFSDEGPFPRSVFSSASSAFPGCCIATYHNVWLAVDPAEDAAQKCRFNVTDCRSRSVDRVNQLRCLPRYRCGLHALLSSMDALTSVRCLGELIWVGLVDVFRSGGWNQVRYRLDQESGSKEATKMNCGGGLAAVSQLQSNRRYS